MRRPSERTKHTRTSEGWMPRRWDGQCQACKIPHTWTVEEGWFSEFHRWRLFDSHDESAGRLRCLLDHAYQYAYEVFDTQNATG